MVLANPCKEHPAFNGSETWSLTRIGGRGSNTDSGNGGGGDDGSDRHSARHSRILAEGSRLVAPRLGCVSCKNSPAAMYNPRKYPADISCERPKFQATHCVAWPSCLLAPQHRRLVQAVWR